MTSGLVTTCLLLFLLPGPGWSASPQADATKEAEIRRLLEVMGSRKLMATMAGQMSEQIRQAMLKGLPPGNRSQQMADAFKQKFMARMDPDKVIELAIPIYARHLSDEEIKGLTKFFESPLGQRYVQVLPQITQESIEASAQWGQEIAREVLQEMQQDFPELRPKEQRPQ